jgi:putative membrane protein
MRTNHAIATSFALALLLAGCGQKTSDTAASAGNSISNAASDTGDVIANAADDVKEAVTPTPTGQEFVDKAAKSDAFEIASAKLAKDKAASADLKSFAAMMVEDHTGSTAKINQAASEASPAIKPDPTLTDDQNKMLADLGKLSGAAFDKEYAGQQVDAHQTALGLMTVYADKGDVPSLKAAAGEIKPKVATHLDAIKAIKDKLR